MFRRPRQNTFQLFCSSSSAGIKIWALCILSKSSRYLTAPVHSITRTHSITNGSARGPIIIAGGIVSSKEGTAPRSRGWDSFSRAAYPHSALCGHPTHPHPPYPHVPPALTPPTSTPRPFLWGNSDPALWRYSYSPAALVKTPPLPPR